MREQNPRSVNGQRQKARGLFQATKLWTGMLFVPYISSSDQNNPIALRTTIRVDSFLRVSFYFYIKL